MEQTSEPRIFTTERLTEHGPVTAYVLRITPDTVFTLLMWLMGLWTGHLWTRKD